MPMMPRQLYVGHVATDNLELDVYPSGLSSFTLYEDDGVTLAYRDGHFATTTIECQQTAFDVRLEISPRSGTYDGMPGRRTFAVRLHLAAKPDRVSLASGGCPEEAMAGPGANWSESERILTLVLKEDQMKQSSARIICEVAE